MISGDYTRHNFFTVLRTLSYKRRQGLLMIEREDKALALLIANGLIVGVDEEDRPITKAIVAKLRVAEKLDDQTARRLLQTPLSLTELYDELVEGGIVSPRSFKMAKSAYEKDTLHSLRNYEGGTYNFKPKIIKHEEELSLNFSPGQLALDMIEMDLDEDEFTNKFGGVGKTDVLLEIKNEVDSRHQSEARLAKLIDAKKPIKAIYNSALVCEHELRCLLSSLYEREILDVENPNSPELESLEGVDPEELIQKAAQKLEAIDFDSENIDLDSDIDIEGSSVDSENFPSIEEKEHEERKNRAWNTWKETAIQKKKASSSIDMGQIDKSWHNRLIAMNYRLLEKSAMESCSMMVVVAFFIVVALIAPNMIEGWFQALDGFSNR